ncbi:hypothetical protein [Alicyclobacillus acidiphilus]|uniref:hypothetical protein n=1 Tax=Alicyclobacillus acidiphilus TaxID=182455 RepID=UPI00082BD13F|nr:hypothetical protein [Alicyclobacillus acidiphilus]
MNKSLLTGAGRILWYLFWALFINVIYIWILRPVVQDLAVYGVLIDAALIVVWLTSIPRSVRRPWVVYTMVVLLIGEGLSTLAFGSVKTSTLGTIVMCVGLLIIAGWFGRVKLLPAFIGVVALVVAEMFIPRDDWAFLDHFKILQESRVHLTLQDMQEAPLAVIHKATGDAIITVDGYVPSSTDLEALAMNATDSPDALYNALQTANGEYQLVELEEQNGHLVKTTPTAKDLALVNPLQLVQAFFPYEIAHWYVNDGQISEYLTPYLDDRDAVATAVNPAAYASSIQVVANQAAQEEIENWDDCLRQLGVSPASGGLDVENGKLTGLDRGKSVSVPIDASTVVGIGHFTSKTDDQALLIGNNELHVVDLATGKVVSTYHGTVDNPVPNDVKIGPLVSGGTDAVFVNAVPAYILTVDSSGKWHQVYTATSSTFRFEAIMPNGQAQPEIVTNDPSMLRNSPTRYFSAYHFVGNPEGHGQLVRDWRVFRTNVVNVTPLKLQADGPEDLALDIYGTGEYMVIQKTNAPLLPIAAILLGLIIVIGWGIRLTRGNRRDAQ